MSRFVQGLFGNLHFLLFCLYKPPSCFSSCSSTFIFFKNKAICSVLTIFRYPACIHLVKPPCATFCPVYFSQISLLVHPRERYSWIIYSLSIWLKYLADLGAIIFSPAGSNIMLTFLFLSIFFHLLVSIRFSKRQ